ncbi:MAG: helix-turn-helix transcriptional regulator [Cyclobacteriaceae bacterium]
MILDHQKFDLFGKMLFEKAIIEPPFYKSNHMHDEACFLYVIEGTYNSVAENEILPVNQGETVLMKCGSYMSRMLSNSKQSNYEAIAVHFYPEVLKKIYDNELPSFLKENNFQFNTNMVKMEASKLVVKYIDSMLFYFQNPALVTEDILILKLKEIILLLLQTESAPQVMEILTNLFSKRTYTFKEVIESHIYHAISPTELAGLTNMSLSTFKREFKKIYSDTPMNYQRKKRLQKAADLLNQSDESISHIAYQCGYNDLAHFTKSFKAQFNLSPSKYRMDAIHK